MTVESGFDPLSSMLEPPSTAKKPAAALSPTNNDVMGMSDFSIDDDMAGMTMTSPSPLPSNADLKLLESSLPPSLKAQNETITFSTSPDPLSSLSYPTTSSYPSAPNSGGSGDDSSFSNYINQISSHPAAATAANTITSGLNFLTTRIQSMSVPQNSHAALIPPTPPSPQHTLPLGAPSPLPPSPQSQSNLKSKLAAAVGDLLNGEKIIMFLTNLSNVTASHATNLAELPREGWYCAMTFYRLILFAHRIPDRIPAEVFDRRGTSVQWQKGGNYHVIQVPLGAIDKVEKILDGYNTVENGSRTLLVTGKDCKRWIKFTNLNVTDCARAFEALITYAFPGRRNLGYLFAFEARRAEVLAGAKSPPLNPRIFDPLVEFTRQRLFEPRSIMRGGKVTHVPSPWVLCQEVNRGYALCGSYPSRFVVPVQAGDNVEEGVRLLRKTAAFRSEGRLPALSWGNGVDGASIWRCSQPKVGLQGNRSAADERYLRHIAEMGSGTSSSSRGPAMSMAYAKMLTGGADVDLNVKKGSLRILDLRPKSSAVANRTTGYGYENLSNYPMCSLSFCGIGNIHAVRDSYNKLSNLCLSPICNDASWTSLVEDTKWMSMLRLILSASWQAAFHVHFHRVPVLLHCSHGWDRTSQVSALAQLFLDPFYRTLEGFAVLVEKDFMAFGHPFHTRAGHGEGSGDSSENQNSPIFVQFLDCAYQIVNQFQNCFEFNSRYLLLISQHVYSCRFGTLLCDNEREREVDANTRQRTHCMWEYFKLNAKKLDLMNPFYQPKKLLMLPLPILLRNVTLWQDYFCRYGSKATIVCMDRQLLNYATPPDSEDTIDGYVEDTCNPEDMMELYCKNDEMIAALKKAQAEAEKWRLIAQGKHKEVNLLREDSGEIVEQVDNVGNEVFTVL